MFAYIVHDANVGVAQGRCGTRFPLEPILCPGTIEEFIRQELQGHRPIEPGVLRFVDETHSTPSERAGDLIVRNGLADFGHRETVSTVYRYSGMHRDYGMLIMNGPGIRQGSTVENAAIHDIAPTILHTMGLPVPADMDGRVLTDAFVPEYTESFPVTIAEPSATSEASPWAGYTEEGEKEIIERLEGLGYLG